MADDPLDLWFKRDVIIHEAALTAYLRRCWPYPDDIHDLRQETYARVYDAARLQIPRVPRPFILAVARRLIIDRIRRQRIVAIDSVGDVDALNVLVDEISPERHLAAHQELRHLAAALDSLPAKCREVMWLRRVDDMSQKEVAAHLGISEKSVEKHIVKGMRRLINAVFGESQTDGPTRQVEEKQGHGKQTS